METSMDLAKFKRVNEPMQLYLLKTNAINLSLIIVILLLLITIAWFYFDSKSYDYIQEVSMLNREVNNFQPDTQLIIINKS
jgi:predicted negative regulator of RcsB-dependent stress response